MRHLFVIDSVDQLHLELDSSIKMGQAMVDLGDDIRFGYIDSLTWTSRDNSARIESFDLVIDKTAQKITRKNLVREQLVEFDSIHMRKEPPLDMNYVEACWMLNSARYDCSIYNDPESLIAINEKISIYHFPEFADQALVSNRAEDFHTFAEDVAEGDIIIKPLGLYGGRGVKRLNLKKIGKDEFLKEIQTETGSGKERRIAQPFNKNIFEGEVRVFGFKDQVLSWCLKKPKKGSFFANTREGATLEPYEPDEVLRAKVTAMGARLSEFGVKVWGIDVIGQCLSEINVTSPRLLNAEGDDLPVYREFAELLRQDIRSKS